MKKWSALTLSSFIYAASALAATNADIDRMTTYAVILGRAAGCGIDTSIESARVGRWMDRKFPPGSQDQLTYLPVFVQGMTYHAKMQSSGSSPDSCAEIRRQIRTFPWP